MNGSHWGSSFPKGFQTVAGSEGTYSSAVPCQSTYYNLGSAVYNKDGFLRHALTFVKVPLVDVGQGWYNVLETENNFLTIEKYDPKTKEINGTFQVTFLIEERSTNDPSDLPDTLRFTEGIFHTRILKD